jgi:hypothetical protein
VAIALVGAALAGTASAGPPKTTDQANALARAMNLVDADLPGWTGERQPRETREERESTDKYLSCAGALARDRALAEVYSRTYESPDSGEDILTGASITSRVVIQRSAGLARHDFAAVTSSHGLKCLRKYGITPANGTKVRVTSGPAPAPGVIAQRVRIRYGRERGGLLLYGDLLWFRRGPAAVLLASLSLDKPVDATEEQRLLSVLLARAQQQIP